MSKKPTISILKRAEAPLPSWLNWLIKILISALFLYVIYNQVISKSDIYELWPAFVERFTITNGLYLAIAVVLVFFNWAVETKKWFLLVSKFENISFGHAFKATPGGSALSILTPNRVGDYGGRILFVKPENNWRAVMALLVGNIAQLMVIISCGAVAGVYFLDSILHFDSLIIKSLAGVCAVFVILITTLYFNVDLLIGLFKRLPFKSRLHKFHEQVQVLKTFDRGELVSVLGWAALRYAIYSTQYFLLLQFFGIEVSLITGFAGIATIFVIQSGIPLPAITGLLARSELALLVWINFTDIPIMILGATFSLWILNLLIPSLIGMVFIYRINLLKSLGYETPNA